MIALTPNLAALVGLWCATVLNGLRSMIEGFIWSNELPGGSHHYWENMTRAVYILQQAVTVTNVPVVLAFGVCGYISIYRLSHLSLLLDVYTVNDILNWLQATWSCSLATQILVTTLIATRIWWVSRQAASDRPSGKQSNMYMTVIWTVVESGAIYAFTATLMLDFFTQRSEVSTVMADALGQISAIVPALIIVRAGLGYSQTGLSTDLRSPLGSKYRSPLQITVDQSVSYDQGFKLPYCNRIDLGPTNVT
ncbi:hypothetical protein ARMGADRAFT_1062676 [Armillaria gallica]|uniref:Uncharacterized protein n=1 Tax=Armillaria gallica TaxID=47427 RepID=A0A2H3DQV1_ARMGA|nr:hypothetical protein ARMGADRAFT_1062676 [Armillaria gallica]